MIGTFGGRHDELLPLVEQGLADNPTILGFKLAHALICTAVGREEVAREVLEDGMASGFTELPLDNMWTTSAIGYAVLAIELHHTEAAAQLLPAHRAVRGLGRVQRRDEPGPDRRLRREARVAPRATRHAEEHLRAALEIADAFGWQYHRATTLFALAQARHLRLGRLDQEARGRLAEAEALCRAGGFQSWLPPIDALLDA